MCWEGSDARVLACCLLLLVLGGVCKQRWALFRGCIHDCVNISKSAHPLFDEHVRCSAHGCSFRRVYGIGIACYACEDFTPRLTITPKLHIMVTNNQALCSH